MQWLGLIDVYNFAFYSLRTTLVPVLRPQKEGLAEVGGKPQPRTVLRCARGSFPLRYTRPLCICKYEICY